MATVELKQLNTIQDWLELRYIRVKPEQRKFTTNLILSYLQARHPAVTGYSIHANNNLIGYVLLIHAENPVQWIIERLTIDKDYQRQGYGYATADQLIDMIYDFDNSEMVVARYDPDNEAARQLAKKLKFEEQEKLYRNRNIALLEFEFEEIEGEEDDEELEDVADDFEADWDADDDTDTTDHESNDTHIDDSGSDTNDTSDD